MFALKSVTHRERPPLPIISHINNYSFPSGHALSSFIFFGILIYIAWHSRLQTFYKWFFTCLLVVFAFLIGMSRIVLKAHYPTDVIASFCLGIVWAITSLWVMRRLTNKSPQNTGAATVPSV